VIILRLGASLDQPDTYGLTPLHLACLNKLTATVELLLAGGNGWNALSYVECRDTDDRTPIHAAAFAKSKVILELLVKYNANVTAVDVDGKSAIHWVLTRDKDTPRCTTAADAIECIEYLQSVGADIKALDKYNRSALHYAAYHNLPSCCVFLLRAGLDPNLPDKRFVLLLQRSFLCS
jgi:serine/threonine-protein phosphatase 6 regulatory ankyrin repeat subunit A